MADLANGTRHDNHMDGATAGDGKEALQGKQERRDQPKERDTADRDPSEKSVVRQAWRQGKIEEARKGKLGVADFKRYGSVTPR